jgi:hypothetical protein
VAPETEMTAGADDPLQTDPEVRQARSTAEAARSRLAACVEGPQVDLVEAQRMLDVLRAAEALAAEYEDGVLVRHGLLTPADADRRAAARRPASAATAGITAAPATAAAPAARPAPSAIVAATRAPSVTPDADLAPSPDGALVIPFRTVQLPVPALPQLPDDARRAAKRATRVLFPLAAAALAGAALARRLRRS